MQHCINSQCKRDPLPKFSHLTKTLGLCQIILNLPKALSAVTWNFVKLFFFFFSPNTSSTTETDIREGSQEKEIVTLMYVLSGPFILGKVKVPHNLSISDLT